MLSKAMNKRIVCLAIPNIITNITVPLLGMVDTAIVGHLNADGQSADYIGAIAIGTMIFNIIYWNFGFLRMGTSGFTAQAYGAKDRTQQMSVLLRACFIALTASLLLIVLQKPIAALVFAFVENKNSAASLAADYFFIRIWAAPATLGIYALKGWFIGMQDSKTPMWISILINVLNIAFSFLLAIEYGMKVKGVALGTVIAQWGGFATTLLFWFVKYGSLRKYINLKHRHLPQNALPYCRNELFHHCFFVNALSAFGCQYIAHATVYIVFLFHGRICIRFRIAMRTLQGSKRLCLTRKLCQTYIAVGRSFEPAFYRSIFPLGRKHTLDTYRQSRSTCSLQRL